MRASYLDSFALLPIEAIKPTARTYNCLKREGINTLGELAAYSKTDLSDIRNFGAGSMKQVIDGLAQFGMQPSTHRFIEWNRPASVAPAADTPAIRVGSTVLVNAIYGADGARAMLASEPMMRIFDRHVIAVVDAVKDAEAGATS